jgi:heterodisulfide reductase subunit A-like polyferredoxin
VTGRPGIFVTGTAMGPMDIVDSIISASAAASEASAYVRTNTKAEMISQNEREAIHA